jgi:hypothetical protein
MWQQTLVATTMCHSSETSTTKSLWLRLILSHYVQFKLCSNAASSTAVPSKPPAPVVPVDQLLVHLVAQQHHALLRTPLHQRRHLIAAQALPGGVAGVDEHKRPAAAAAATAAAEAAAAK